MGLRDNAPLDGSGSGMLSEALSALDGESEGADPMAGDPRRSGRPSKTQIRAGVRDAAKVKARAERSRAVSPAVRQRALAAIQGRIVPFIILPPSPDLDAAITNKIRHYAASAVGQIIIGALEKGADPRKALSAKVIQDALASLNREVGGRLSSGFIATVAQGSAMLLAQNDVISTILALKAVADMVREVEGWGARPAKQGASDRFDGEDESGWQTAARRLRPVSRPAAVPAAAGTRRAAPAAIPVAQAQQALSRAVAPAFAAAIDTAVHPDLIVRYARQHAASFDLTKLRQNYVAAAARQFATEFARTIASAPKGTSESLALGAIIASALAQSGRKYALIPPAAVPAMSVLIHKTLQPRLPALARIAAAIATARPATAPRATAALRELAW